MSVATPIVETWDGENRRIHLKEGVSDYFPIEDLYTEYRNVRRTDEAFRVWNPLLLASGNVPKGGGVFTPRYVVLLDGTKIVPFDEVLKLSQLGDMITDDPDTDASLYDISTLTVPKVIFIKPSEAEIIQLNSESIVYASFQGMVWLDVSSTYSDKGTAIEPNGNAERPVNNLTVALEIAIERGFKVLKFRSGYDIVETLDMAGMTILGESHVYIEIDMGTNANVENVTVKEAIISGVMDSNTSVRNCVTKTMQYVNGHIHNCAFNGRIDLNNDEDSFMDGCRQLDIAVTPQIGMGFSGQNLVMTDYIGLVEIYDLQDVNSKLGIGLAGGRVILDTATVTAGFVHISGDGQLMDELGNIIHTGMWNTNVMVVNELSASAKEVAEAVWDEPYADHKTAGTFGKLMDIIRKANLAVDGIITANSTAVSFDTNLNQLTGSFDCQLLIMTSGALEGYMRPIKTFVNGIDNTITLQHGFPSPPAVDDEFTILPEHVHDIDKIADGLLDRTT